MRLNMRPVPAGRGMGSISRRTQLRVCATCLVGSAKGYRAYKRGRDGRTSCFAQFHRLLTAEGPPDLSPTTLAELRLDYDRCFLLDSERRCQDYFPSTTPFRFAN